MTAVWNGRQQLANRLPGLNQVRFVDLKTGYPPRRRQRPVSRPACAKPSIRGNPGCRSPARAPPPGWRGIFHGRQVGNARGGVGAGWGQCAATNARPRITATVWTGRDVTGVQILRKKALAVGQGGLIARQFNSGARPGIARAEMAGRGAGESRFPRHRAVKDQVWIGGPAWLRLMHTADAGTTWKLHKTGQPLPLHGIFFFDDKIGWAVGDAGTILATSDGGTSWTLQHQAANGRRACVSIAQHRDAPIDTSPGSAPPTDLSDDGPAGHAPPTRPHRLGRARRTSAATPPPCGRPAH